jgi:hypothetical protein
MVVVGTYEVCELSGTTGKDVDAEFVVETFQFHVAILKFKK